jgi:hypothetical protein
VNCWIAPGIKRQAGEQRQDGFGVPNCAMFASAAMKTTAFRIRKNPMMPQDGNSGSTADAASFYIISPRDSAATDA